MLKRCEECGYIYSSKAEICPRCGCPNIHKENERILNANREHQGEQIKMSFAGMIVSIILFFLLRNTLDLSNVGNLFMLFWFVTFVGGIISWIGCGIIAGAILFIVMIVATGFIMEFIHAPNWLQFGVALIYIAIPLYFTYIRPFVNLYKRKQYKQMLDGIHQYPNTKQEDDFKEQPRDERIRDDAMQVEFTEHDI